MASDLPRSPLAACVLRKVIGAPRLTHCQVGLRQGRLDQVTQKPKSQPPDHQDNTAQKALPGSRWPCGNGQVPASQVPRASQGADNGCGPQALAGGPGAPSGYQLPGCPQRWLPPEMGITYNRKPLGPQKFILRKPCSSKSASWVVVRIFGRLLLTGRRQQSL